MLMALYCCNKLHFIIGTITNRWHFFLNDNINMYGSGYQYIITSNVKRCVVNITVGRR